jgi:hypothetical protein
VFKKLWPEFWGPRLEHVLRNTLYTLLEFQDHTLLDVARLLTDKKFREQAVRKVTDPQLKEFWLKEFEKYSARLKAEATAPILNKIGHIVTTKPLRHILGQVKSTFRFGHIINRRKILIANLSKGTLGEDNSALLGALLVTLLQMAALSRTSVEEERRHSFYLYVDEFQNFATESFADILSEARKYGLSLVLAHQHLAQLEERIRAAVFGNIGTMITFRVGVEDAQFLRGEFAPQFSEEELVRLPNYHIYLKLMIDGKTSEPFSAVTLPSKEPKKSFEEAIIKASRKKYAQRIKSVERELLHAATDTSKPAKRVQRSLFG